MRLQARDTTKLLNPQRTCPTVPLFRRRPNVNLYPANDNYPGQVISQRSVAYHGTESEMVFGYAAGVSGLPNTPTEDKMIALMQGAWAAFSRDPEMATSKCGWPGHNESNESLIRLAYDNMPTAESVSPGLYLTYCANYTPSA